MTDPAKDEYPLAAEMRALREPVVCSGLVRDACPQPDAWKDKDDKPLPEDEQIEAAFPTRSGRHDLYAEAMRLVGARYSKGGLVALVTWLLCEKERAFAAGELEPRGPEALPPSPFGPKCPMGDACENAIYVKAYKDVDAEHSAFLATENERLRKWFRYLVAFVHADQCIPNEADPEPCQCCLDYLRMAEHAAKQSNLLQSEPPAKVEAASLNSSRATVEAIDDIVAKHWGAREPGHQRMLVEELSALFTSVEGNHEKGKAT